MRNFYLSTLASVVICLGAPSVSLGAPAGEVEPNDTNLTTNILYPGQFGVGNINTGPEFDGWLIPNVNTDQFFCIHLHAIESATGGNDPVVRVNYDHSIADDLFSDHYNDDGGPPSDVFKDSLICGEKVKRAGSLFVRVDGFGSSTLQPYNLFQVVVSPNEVLPEAEPNDTPATAMPIQSPAILANGSSDFDFYSFNAFAGERIVAFVDQDPGRPDPATPFISSFAIFASDGTTDITESLLPGEHLLGPDGGNPARGYGALPAPYTGTYFIRVGKSSGDDGDYRLVVLVDGDSPSVGACCVSGTCDFRTASNCRGKFGGIGSVCGSDPDADGYFDGCDNCASSTNPEQEDVDADDVGDLCDTCATDSLKVIPGACGCGTKDTDTDGDGVADCNDQCPADSRESIPGACGCGVAETDGNGNGVFDCLVGEDGKATLRARLLDLSAKLTSLKTKKKPSSKVATPIKDLLSQIQAVVQAAGSQIGLSQGGFDLNAETAKLAKVIGATLKSKSKKLKKNRSSSLKQVQAILSALG